MFFCVRVTLRYVVMSLLWLHLLKFVFPTPGAVDCFKKFLLMNSFPNWQKKIWICIFTSVHSFDLPRNRNVTTKRRLFDAFIFPIVFMLKEKKGSCYRKRSLVLFQATGWVLLRSSAARTGEKKMSKTNHSTGNSLNSSDTFLETGTHKGKDRKLR